MWWLVHGEVDVPANDEWLSTHERAQLDSIRFTKRRNEYLTRRWTAKQAIAARLDIDPSPDGLRRIEVRRRPTGAPHVHLDGRPADVDVSMTDRSGWAACLVGPTGSAASGTLGVDLEVVEPRTERFVADFFTAAEVDHVGSLRTADARDEAANLIWSAKEAALKVLQTGLRSDTRTVEVHLDPGPTRDDGWRSMSVTGPNGTMPGWWRRDGVFVLTIASVARAEPPTRMAIGSDLAAAIPHHSWLDRPRC